MWFVYNCGRGNCITGGEYTISGDLPIGCLYYLDDNAGGNTTSGVTELLL